MTKLQPQLNSPLAYDPLTNLYWYTNLPLLFGSYSRQSEIISTLKIEGFTNFRFATKQEVTSLQITDVADAFVFTPTEYPSLHNTQNGPGFYWAGRCSDVNQATPQDATYRDMVELCCDPLKSNQVSTNSRGIEDSSNVVEAPDLLVSAWVVCVKLQARPNPPSSLRV